MPRWSCQSSRCTSRLGLAGNSSLSQRVKGHAHQFPTTKALLLVCTRVEIHPEHTRGGGRVLGSTRAQRCRTSTHTHSPCQPAREALASAADAPAQRGGHSPQRIHKGTSVSSAARHAPSGYACTSLCASWHVIGLGEAISHSAKLKQRYASCSQARCSRRAPAHADIPDETRSRVVFNKEGNIMYVAFRRTHSESKNLAGTARRRKAARTSWKARRASRATGRCRRHTRS